MAVLWWEHGVCVVCTKQKCFANTNYRRFDEGQFTEVGCKTNMLTQCIIVVCSGRTALDDDRSGGRVDGMEWCGLGWGRVGVGGWGGARGKGKEVTTVQFRLQQHGDGIVRFDDRNKRVLLKHIVAHL